MVVDLLDADEKELILGKRTLTRDLGLALVASNS